MIEVLSQTGPIALLLNMDGGIVRVVRDDLGVEPELAPGDPLIELFAGESREKARRFLAEIRDRSAAFDWELTTLLRGEATRLHFAGGVAGANLLIVGGRSQAMLSVFFYEEIMHINNEQVNALRALLKEQYAPDALGRTRDENLYIELTRLNNQLVSTQRELAKRNEELRATNDALRREVRERMRAESQLERRSAELARSNDDLRQFAYVASHDLQEPLRAMAGFADLLEQRHSDRLETEAREFLGYITDGATRMQNLIRSLLDFSRVDSRGGDFQEFDGNVLLLAVRHNLQRLLEESATRLTHDEMPRLRGDEGQLTQVLQNLVGNAVKFQAQGRTPEVHIGVHRREGAWEITVSDNGIGIEARHFERIFGIFQRLHTRREYAGTGIGLAICKRIVERHAGRIWVESTPGEGATFHFTVPD